MVSGLCPFEAVDVGDGRWLSAEPLSKQGHAATFGPCAKGYSSFDNKRRDCAALHD